MYCIVGNVISDKILRTGARVYIIDPRYEFHSVIVRGLNKFGRATNKHIPWKRIENIRVGYIPPKLQKYCKLWWDDKEQAQLVASELNQIWKDVQSIHPDGRIIKEGMSLGQAVSIYSAKHNIPKWSVRLSVIESIKDRLIEISKIPQES